jgi:uncharacterized protein YhfF
LAEDRMAMEFGWEDDGGLGELLIAQTLAGTKTATCGFKRQYSDDELRQVRASVGRTIPVVDHRGAVRAHIRILDVFETPFGDPDPRLVRGEGDGGDVVRFQADHRAAWRATVGEDVPLPDDEPLVVELYELAEDPEDYGNRS